VEVNNAAKRGVCGVGLHFFKLSVMALAVQGFVATDSYAMEKNPKGGREVLSRKTVIRRTSLDLNLVHWTRALKKLIMARWRVV
jgi:hypothetical protein